MEFFLCVFIMGCCFHVCFVVCSGLKSWILHRRVRRKLNRCLKCGWKKPKRGKANKPQICIYLFLKHASILKDHIPQGCTLLTEPGYFVAYAEQWIHFEGACLTVPQPSHLQTSYSGASVSVLSDSVWCSGGQIGNQTGFFPANYHSAIVLYPCVIPSWDVQQPWLDSMHP